MGLFPSNDARYDAVYAEESALVEASELIAEAMEACSASRADLARALAVSRSEVTSRLQGRRNMTIKSLAATLHALGAELELGVRLPARSAQPTVPTDMDAYRLWRSASETRAQSAATRDDYYFGKAIAK